MKEHVLKTFWRDTYQSKSPIPFIISAQVAVFVLIHFFDLLQDVNLIQIPLYNYAVEYLSLPLPFRQAINQPWAIITHPFLYTDLFDILFDCLWLYWMGNIFLTFLNTRQFLFLFSSSTLLSGLLYLGLGFIPVLQHSSQLAFHGAGFALTALVAAVATLTPSYQVRLLLFGNVSLKTIAIVYICLEVLFTGLMDKTAGITLLASACLGILFIRSLKQGRDLSLFKKRVKKARMQVVHHNSRPQSSTPHFRHCSDLPNQEEIDEILDKISVGGYESLTSREKEVLFKASKSER